jgi:hypothetical protein
MFLYDVLYLCFIVMFVEAITAAIWEVGIESELGGVCCVSV